MKSMAKTKKEIEPVEEVVDAEKYYVLNVAGDFNITVNDGGKVYILQGKPTPPSPGPPH